MCTVHYPLAYLDHSVQCKSLQHQLMTETWTAEMPFSGLSNQENRCTCSWYCRTGHIRSSHKRIHSVWSNYCYRCNCNFHIWCTLWAPLNLWDHPDSKQGCWNTERMLLALNELHRWHRCKIIFIIITFTGHHREIREETSWRLLENRQQYKLVNMA